MKAVLPTPPSPTTRILKHRGIVVDALVESENAAAIVDDEISHAYSNAIKSVNQGRDLGRVIPVGQLMGAAVLPVGQFASLTFFFCFEQTTADFKERISAQNR